ncbi:MAG: hypothetical protein SAK42_14500 [Oscillatoria sp. PMC 1076.18]|nr:hypothetical protein [Oscillatoria sp. PMC 1076.18]
MCVTHSLVGILCLPEGDRVETIMTAECANSYKCRFSSEIPDDSFKIYVVDVDATMNDLIGSGHCAKGKTCDVGQATVSISDSEKKSCW